MGTHESTTTVGGVVIGDPTEITSVPNSVAALDGNNAQPVIIVDGSQISRQALSQPDRLLHRRLEQCLGGLIIDGFGVGVSIPGPDDVGDLVQGNFIGQYFLSQYDPTTGILLPAPNSQVFTGTGNSLQGVLLGSTNATIGGVEPAG